MKNTKKKGEENMNKLAIVMWYLLFFVVFSDLGGASSARAQNTTQPVNIGVVVDYETWAGKMGLSCIEMAVSEFYASQGIHYKTRLVIHSRNSNSDVIGAASAGN